MNRYAISWRVWSGKGKELSMAKETAGFICIVIPVIAIIALAAIIYFG